MVRRAARGQRRGRKTLSESLQVPTTPPSSSPSVARAALFVQMRAAHSFDLLLPTSTHLSCGRRLAPGSVSSRTTRLQARLRLSRAGVTVLPLCRRVVPWPPPTCQDSPLPSAAPARARPARRTGPSYPLTALSATRTPTRAARQPPPRQATRTSHTPPCPAPPPSAPPRRLRARESPSRAPRARDGRSVPRRPALRHARWCMTLLRGASGSGGHIKRLRQGEERARRLRRSSRPEHARGANAGAVAARRGIAGLHESTTGSRAVSEGRAWSAEPSARAECGREERERPSGRCRDTATLRARAAWLGNDAEMGARADESGLEAREGERRGKARSPSPNENRPRRARPARWALALSREDGHVQRATVHDWRTPARLLRVVARTLSPAQYGAPRALPSLTNSLLVLPALLSPCAWPASSPAPSPSASSHCPSSACSAASPGPARDPSAAA